MTIKEVSVHIRKELGIQYPISEIENFVVIIFNALMGYKRSDLYLKADETIPSKIQLQIYNIIEQLKGNRPIQYILGTTEFYGFPFFVDESVLIPRPETEELVKWILDDTGKTAPRIVDVGTGSGCIPVALAKMLPDAKVCGIDISEDALKTAQKNSVLNKVKIDFRKIDILSETTPDIGSFDIVVSNPPYVTYRQKGRMEANVLDYEPHLALFVPDADPLIFYKAIARFAKKTLIKGGCLYFEINEELALQTVSAIEQFGFSTELRKDINDKYRMIKAILP